MLLASRDTAGGRPHGVMGPRSNPAPFSRWYLRAVPREIVIAVIDDEESVRRALRRLLRSAGFDVETYPTGAEFLESILKRPPDCAILDLHMPGVNGFQVQQRLAETNTRVPVIVITGHDTEESHNRALGAGACAYLRKPVDDEILLEAIEAAVASYKN